MPLTKHDWPSMMGEIENVNGSADKSSKWSSTCFRNVYFMDTMTDDKLEATEQYKGETSMICF